MPRTPPSGAEAQLLAVLAERGLRVSRYQLERWRTAHLLPRNPREWLGRGRGSRSELLPEVVNRAVWLASVSQQGRSLGAVAWGIWAHDGTREGLKQLRQAVTLTLERYGRRLTAGAAAGEQHWQARWDAAATAAGRVHSGHDQHAMLRVFATEAFGDPDAVPELPRVDRPELAQVMARILVGGADDVGQGEFHTALLAVWPEQRASLQAAEDAHRQQILSGRAEWADFPLAKGWARLQDVVSAADDAVLARAVELVTSTAGAVHLVVTLLGPSAALGEQPPPGAQWRVPRDAMRIAMNDPMWAAWGRHMSLPGTGFAWQAIVAFHTAMTLLLPAQADELTRYRHPPEGAAPTPGGMSNR